MKERLEGGLIRILLEAHGLDYTAYLKLSDYQHCSIIIFVAENEHEIDENWVA